MLSTQTIDPNQRKEPAPLLRPFLAAWHWLVPPSQAHEDRETRTARIVRTSLVAGFSIALIVVALVWGRDLRDLYQDWRAERLVKQARKLAEDGNVANAVWKAQEAYSLSPENTNAIRINGEFLTLMKRQEAVYYLEKLEKQGKATADDQQIKVKALLNLNRKKEASDTLTKLMRTTAPNENMFKLAEDVWGARERSNVVLQVLSEYCRQHPDDLESLLRLAKFQIVSSVREEETAGMATLWELAGKPEEIGLKALEALDQVAGLSAEDGRRLVDMLEHHPKADGWHHVSALKRRIRLAPAQRARLIQDTVMRYRTAKREDRVPLVRWLVEEREFLQVAALVDEQDAKSYRPLLENYLTALTMLGRLDELARLVNDPQVIEILNKSLRAFYQAHLAFVTRKPKEEIRRLVMAAKLAAEGEGRGDLLLAIAKYAEDRGITDVAEDAYRAAATIRRTERTGHEGLVRSCQANGNIEGLIVAAREAVRRWPDDENFMERYLYANLLAGREIELSLERTLSLLDKRPDDSPTKIAAALGYFRFGDIDMSINHCQGVDLNHCSPGQQAVFAFLAREGGYGEAVGTVLKSIAPDAKMLPQERDFFERARK